MSVTPGRVNLASLFWDRLALTVIAAQERSAFTHQRVVGVQCVRDIKQLRWEINERHRPIGVDDKFKSIERGQRGVRGGA